MVPPSILYDVQYFICTILSLLHGLNIHIFNDQEKNDSLYLVIKVSRP